VLPARRSGYRRWAITLSLKDVTGKYTAPLWEAKEPDCFAKNFSTRAPLFDRPVCHSRALPPQ
jgi:hypothetical protein